MEDSPTDAPAQFPEDLRPNQEWLRAWFASTHADVQWAKSQSWNAVQWSIILLAAVYAGSLEKSMQIHKGVWLVSVVVLTVMGVWWLIDLHRFAKSARDSSEKIVGTLKDRNHYLPERRLKDPDHKKLLAVKLVVVLGAAGVIFAAIANK